MRMVNVSFIPRNSKLKIGSLYIGKGMLKAWLLTDTE